MARLCSPKVPKKESGFSVPLVLLGVAAAVVLLIYFSDTKGKKTDQESPQQTQEQAKKPVEEKKTIDNVPNPVNDFLNNNDIDEYTKVGMKIYKGNNPPNIEGIYSSNSLVIFYDKPFKDAAPVGTEVSSYNHVFYDQKSDGTIKLLRKPLEGEDMGSGMGGFISGDNNCFSIFMDVQDDDGRCSVNEATIYSGCKTDEGLRQLKAGFITKSMEGPDCSKSVPVGHLRIISEDDGLAERVK